MAEDRYPCPEWVVAFLEYIEGDLDRVMWNLHQTEYESPFRNTGNRYENQTFAVAAYDWGWHQALEEWAFEGLDPHPPEQPANFTWQDTFAPPLKIYWYKALGRGTEMNRELSPEEGIRMLNECLAAVRAEEQDDD